MTETRALSTTYVAGEGRAFLDQCMEATFAHCRDHHVDVVVIYTGSGEGPCIAVERYSQRPEFSNIRIVAVTPPANRPYVVDPNVTAKKRQFTPAGVFGERRKVLFDAGVPIVSARLPFRSMSTAADAARPGAQLAEPMQLVDKAFGILGGGFSYCVQAVLMACDAGAIATGDRVAAMSADTAMVMYACQSESFLSAFSGVLVEHVICRPMLYDVSKRTHQLTQQVIAQNEEAAAPAPASLPAGGDDDDDDKTNDDDDDDDENKAESEEVEK